MQLRRVHSPRPLTKPVVTVEGSASHGRRGLLVFRSARLRGRGRALFLQLTTHSELDSRPTCGCRRDAPRRSSNAETIPSARAAGFPGGTKTVPGVVGCRFGKSADIGDDDWEPSVHGHVEGAACRCPVVGKRHNVGSVKERRQFGIGHVPVDRIRCLRRMHSPGSSRREAPIPPTSPPRREGASRIEPSAGQEVESLDEIFRPLVGTNRSEEEDSDLLSRVRPRCAGGERGFASYRWLTVLVDRDMAHAG